MWGRRFSMGIPSDLDSETSRPPDAGGMEAGLAIASVNHSGLAPHIPADSNSHP